MASDLLTQLEILMMLKCFLEFLLMCFFVGPCHLDLRQLPGIKYRFLIQIIRVKTKNSGYCKVSLLGVDSLWGDSRLIPADS